MNYNIQEELLREVKGLQCQNYSQINKLQTNLKSFILASENKGQRECNTNLNVYVVVQFYPWFKFYFLLFETHYQKLPYQKQRKIKFTPRIN